MARTLNSSTSVNASILHEGFAFPGMLRCRFLHAFSGVTLTFQVLLRFVNQGVRPDLSLLFPRWLAGSLEPNMKLYQFEWMESLNSKPHLPPWIPTGM